MTLLLTRNKFRPDGIFSTLTDESGNKLAVTLEHSYDCSPKIANGTYNCVRSKHRLHGMDHDFETFEVTHVLGHTGILFHWGNYNCDSDGCILLGKTVQNSSKAANTTLMITNSKVAFSDFMKSLEGINSFTLTVR